MYRAANQFSNWKAKNGYEVLASVVFDLYKKGVKY